jgi:uncharacterized membrane protein
MRPGRGPGTIPAREEAHLNRVGFFASTATHKGAAAMSQIIETIDVDVPVRVAYNQWTQFESFPKFMEAVQKVEQLDDTTLRWTAQIAGVTKTWTAKITEQEPDQRIAWTSIEGARNGGVVTFHRIDDHKTRITLQLDVEPEGPVEKVGDALGVVERQAKQDLKRFKEFIESQGVATGAWRGEVRQDDVNG